MAISIFHNPSDNKLRSFRQMLLRGFPQGGSLRFRRPADLLRTGLRAGLSLPDQLFAGLGRFRPYLL